MTVTCVRSSETSTPTMYSSDTLPTTGSPTTISAPKPNFMCEAGPGLDVAGDAEIHRADGIYRRRREAHAHHRQAAAELQERARRSATAA